MAASFGWGTLAASSLMIGAIISNLPEAISSTCRLATAGRNSSRTLWMWIGIALVSGLASPAGDALFQHPPPDTVAFAAGAILTMLADTMMPRGLRARRQAGRCRDDPRFRRRLRDAHTRLTWRA